MRTTGRLTHSISHRQGDMLAPGAEDRLTAAASASACALSMVAEQSMESVVASTYARTVGRARIQREDAFARMPTYG